MKKIDTSNWEEIKLGDICEIVRGKSKIINKLSDGDTPIVSSGRKNQGIVGNYNVEAEYSDTITIACNGSCGSTFYHDGPFATTGDTAVCLFKRNISYEAKLFIASILDNYLTLKYNYKQKCNPEVLSNERIKLPIMNKYKPDWQLINKLANCNFGGGYSMKNIDASKWAEFKIGDLFEIERGKESSPNRVEDGEIPMINEINTNNGVAKFGDSDNIISGNAITVSVNYAKNVFYQPSDFIASVNILVLRNKFLNDKIGLFIACALREIHEKYNYTNKISKERLENETLKLPVMEQYTPDWHQLNELTNCKLGGGYMI